jgi:hypothetical protein
MTTVDRGEVDIGPSSTRPRMIEVAMTNCERLMFTWMSAAEAIAWGHALASLGEMIQGGSDEELVEIITSWATPPIQGAPTLLPG